jgi:hypothetical protein
MAFLKFTEGARPGKKLPTPKRSEEEMNDSRRRYEQKRARKFQTSWMKGRPWLFHDKEADKTSCLWCTENNV